MRKLWVFPCLLMLACGGGDTLPTAPSIAARPSQPTPPQPTPPLRSESRTIEVGEPVSGTLTAHGTEVLFAMMAPSDGVLVARLTWEPKAGRLALKLADAYFQHDTDDLSPLVGTLPVVAGQTYRLTVLDSAPWDYDDLLLPFVLTTSIQ